VDISVIIPAYNEANGIEPTLRELAATMAESGLEHEIVVVDDGSTDGTSATVDALVSELPAVRLVRHPHNRGYGAALKTGIRSSRAGVITITDADGTYPNERIPELYHRLVDESADMVVGSRTGASVHIPLIRRPAKAFLRWLANYLSGRKIPDLNSGLRVMGKDAVSRHFRLVSDGFSFTTTTLLAMLASNQHVVYVPIDYHQRIGGSKIRPIRDTFNFMVLILRASVFFEPLKVFMPIAMALFAAGLGWTAYEFFVNGHGLAEGGLFLFVASLQTGLAGLIADMISRRD